MAPRAASGPVARSNPSSPPRLDVFCDSVDDCPASVGMVVFPGADAPERCTGTLVGPDLVLTAGHCLDPQSRRRGEVEDGFVAFPESGAYPARWHRVVEVLQVAEGVGEEVLRADYAVVRLEQPTLRPAAPVASEGPTPGAIVTVAVVTPHPIYATQHRLETRLCRVADGAAARDALGPDAAAVGWLSDCPILPGNSGSPVFDHEGRVRALVHGGSHPFFGIGVTSDPPTLPEIVERRP